MKAVVVEIRGRLAAVLSDDGRITKVKNQNYAIGQVIEMRASSPKLLRFNPAAATAAAAAVVAVCGISSYAYFTPYSYVSLDVNPSIEFSLNRFDRVLSVTGVNDDGEEIVKQLKLDTLDNKKIEKAIAQTVQQIKNEGYFDGDTEAGIVISASGKDLNKAEKLAKNLKEDAQTAAGVEDILVESSSVGLERVQRARELGVTPGKLNLVEKLRDSAENPDNVYLEEWLDKPVKEIMKEIKQNRQKDKHARPKSGQENAVASGKFVDVTSDQNEKVAPQAEETSKSKAEKAEAKAEKTEAKAEAKTERTEASRSKDREN